MQVLFGLSAFRLSAGDIAAYGVLPLPHGGIRLSRLISDLRFGGRLPAACPALRSDFRGALHGGCYRRLQARGDLHAFFHYYKSQIARDCGAAVPPRLRFRCRVRDFVRARLFIYRRAARISPEMAEFRRKCFLPGGTLAHGAPLIREKFPRSCALSGEGVFPSIPVRIAGGENAFVKAPKNDTFCKFERKFIHFTQFFIDKRHCLPYN